MSKQANPNLQARLAEINSQSALEDVALLRQVKLIKGRFRRLQAARL